MPDKITQERSAFISSLPDSIANILVLIENNAQNENGMQLVQLVASFVHPDMVCSLMLMGKLPEDQRKAAADFIHYCLFEGLSAQQSADLYHFINPRLLGLFQPR